MPFLLPFSTNKVWPLWRPRRCLACLEERDLGRSSLILEVSSHTAEHLAPSAPVSTTNNWVHQHIHNIKSAVSHVIWVYFLICRSCEGQDITAALCCLPWLVSGNSLTDTYSTIVLYLLLWHPPFLSAINKVSYFLSYPIYCTVLYYFICHMQLYIVQCTVTCILYTCINRKREREKNTVVKQ